MEISTPGFEMEQSELPPPIPKTELSERPALSRFGRKRTREEYLADSSDPPLFSSDDIPASSENYGVDRNKRHYKGAWWGKNDDMPSLADGTVHRSKRGAFRRTLDSAVWMGSDDTEEEDEGDRNVEEAFGGLEQELVVDPVRFPMPDLQARRQRVSCQAHVPPSWQTQPEDLERFQIAQKDAAVYVSQCVEDCVENIDLSDRQLEQVRDSTLRPLQSLVKMAPDFCPNQEAYQAFTTHIRLFLANNLLQQLPGQIYRLESLNVLSLRHNQLTELLPSIANLHNLSELNISNNLLRWLPWEIVHLLDAKLKTISFHGNPFLCPTPRLGMSLLLRDNVPGPDYPEKQGRQHSPEASTEIAYLNINGTPCRASIPAPSGSINHFSPPIRMTSNIPERCSLEGKPWQGKPNHVFSLLELALQKCSASQILGSMPEMLPADCPPSLVQLLHEAWKAREAGGKACSVCGRKYITPRTEWVEWWAGLGHGQLVPLIRRGCSWQCTANFDDIPDQNQGCGWTDESSAR